MLRPYAIVYQHSDLTTGTWHRFHYTLPEAESSARYLLKRDLPGTRLKLRCPRRCLPRSQLYAAGALHDSCIRVNLCDVRKRNNLI